MMLSFQLNLFTGQFGLQAIHLKDQFLLDLTLAKKAGLISREGLTQKRRKVRKRSKKEARKTDQKEGEKNRRHLPKATLQMKPLPPTTLPKQRTT
jgi:hypothetical protein